MATVSELVVLVTANTASFQKGMASASKTTSGFSAVAKAGFALAAVAAVKFAADSVQAYTDHQEALLQLQTTISNSPALIGASTAAFEEQATALQNLTGVQDEEILKAEAVLGRFNLTAAQLEKVTPLVLDYARATGQDVVAASSSIGKALLGNARALKTVGINFTATGKTGQDFNTIVGALQSKVGGLSTAYGKTLPGQLAIAEAKFDDVKETVGKALIPILSKLADIASKTLIPALQLIADHIDGVMTAAAGFTIWKLYPALIGAVSSAVTSLTITVESLNVSLLGAATTLGTIAQVLPLAGLGFGGYKEDVFEGNKVIQDFADGNNEATDSLTNGASAAAAAAAKQASFAESVANTTEQLKAQRVATQQLAGGLLGLTADAQDLVEKQNRVNAMLAAGHDSGKRYREAVLDLLNAQLQFKNDAAGFVANLKESGLSLDEAVDKVVNLGKHVGLTRKDVLDALGPLDQYRTRLDNIPESVSTTVTADTHQAVNKLASLSASAAQLVAHDYEMRIHAKEVPGSPIPTELIKMLNKKLRELTGRDWEISIHADTAVARLKEVQKALEDAIKAIEKRLDTVSSSLDKVRSKAQAFTDTIKGAFSEFMDIGGAFGSAEEGTPLSTVIAQQLAGAENLAGILEALKRQGAGKALLGQVAEQGAGFGQALLQGGPAQIAEANAALNTIADLAQQTGKGLSEVFFGQKIDKLEHKLDIIHEDLRQENQAEKIIVNIQGWVGNDQDIAKKLRDELVKLGKRNVTTGI